MITPSWLERSSMTAGPRFTKPRCRPDCWLARAMTPAHSVVEELVTVARPEFAASLLDRHVAVRVRVGGDVVRDAADGTGWGGAVLVGRAGNRLLQRLRLRGCRFRPFRTARCRPGWRAPWCRRPRATAGRKRAG